MIDNAPTASQLPDYASCEVPQHGNDWAFINSMLDEFPVSIFIKNEDRRLNYVNKANELIFERSRADAIGASDDERPDKQKMFAGVIIKSSASLLTIINDILDFSKIDARQMQLDPEPFKLATAIEDVATLVSSRVAEKDVEMIVRCDSYLPKYVLGDPGRIRQILTNMVGNAVKFTDLGHVFIDVSPVESKLHPDASGCSRIRVEVKDTGIGIPEEKLNLVFEKFAQVDSSASRKHEGTGLGLSIASSLVRLMDGEIGATSEIGEGSTFWFEVELPIEKSER